MNLALALLTAALLILSFPRFDLVWLAPVALAPLLFAMARERPARRFLYSWVAGAVFWFGVCYWIQFVLAVHGGLGQLGGWAVFLLFCLAKGLHLAVFGWLAGYILPKPWAIPAVAALWAGLERTHGTFGFAWLALGNAGIDMGVPMRLAPFVGVYGLSFVFAAMATAVALVMLRRPRRELIWLALFPLLFLLPELPQARRPQRSLVAVQPVIDDDQQWTLESLEETVRRLSILSLQSALAPGQRDPELIAWPEVPAPFYYESNAAFREPINQLARTTRTPVLIGTVAFTPSGAPLNSATFVSSKGEYVGRYDKIFLVPFGEFVPPFFTFVQKISSETGDFSPGKEIVTFPLNGRKIGTFICYESVFPHLVRQFALKGAEVFVNLSNDGYFGNTAAREQHLKNVRMRSAENRRWTLRVTNNGISGAIDPAGRLTETLPSFSSRADRLHYDYVSEVTPYTRHGDWFAWSCLAGGLLAASAGAYRRQKQNPEA
ncbi:MAG: apolipoprotein N-acyltransferase [Bryobacteraceae bacterium]|nr:apolipoprotein N-acyltransferase [Bryobacteraceae bacterium]